MEVRLMFNKEDVDWEMAWDAHRGTSMVPGKRADERVSAYLAEMQGMVDEFSQYATKESVMDINADLETYRVEYLKKLWQFLYARSRVMSTLTIGPAKFPTRSNEKKNATADRRRDEWLVWRKKFKKKMRQKYDPKRIARASIRAGDPDAVERLRAKIEKAEAVQELMKAANKIIRKKGLTDEDRKAQLTALGLTLAQVCDLLLPDYAGRKGFASYQLSNNSANIRRMKKRIEALEAEAVRREEGPGGYMVGEIEVVENHELNRLQIIFPDKPDLTVRRQLKARGFRWALLQGAWQRQLNEAARVAAWDILGQVDE